MEAYMSIHKHLLKAMVVGNCIKTIVCFAIVLLAFLSCIFIVAPHVHSDIHTSQTLYM